MPKILSFCLLLLFLLLSALACNRRADAVPPAMPTMVSTAVSPTATAVPPPTSPSPNQADLFRAGLVSAALDGLDRLDSAPFYHLTLTIDPVGSTVVGQQLIRYTNIEDVSLDDIYLHLFPNLLGGRIEVSNFRLDGRSVNLLYEEINDSVLRVPLPALLAPGDTVEMTLDFITAVPPETGRNYGVFANVDGVMALAHFYPMLAVYDHSGWNIATPAVFGDATYSDAAFYIVELTAPADQVVVGSGVLTTQSASSETQTQTLAAGPARDFYLVLSSDYAVETVTVGETTINSYAPSAFAASARQAAEHAAVALRIFNARYGDYPYTELDIVATPTLALGIEYPGVIAITQREYDPDNPISAARPNSAYLESTVVHEVGHQWFYNVVGNDQLDEPWLDEALAQYVTGVYYGDYYGAEAAQDYADSWRSRWTAVSNAEIPIGLPVSDYEGAAYSAIVYGRGPLFILALAQEMGEPAFDNFMRDYVAQFAWEIATTKTFMALAERHCQCDLTDLFATWVNP
ncbi:MAG: M1 family metallopeptidase [Chloroflexi bacterium]|nr:M1 family metallopeptidase [Chloroflexota bacterium]